MSTNLNLVKIIFIINITFITLSFYFQSELFSNLAILCAAISLMASVIFDKKVFNSNLFLFLSTLPIYLIVPVYQNPMLAALLITLLISILIYKKQVFELFNLGKIKDIRIWLAVVVVSLVASISLIVWGISTNKLTGVGAATSQELEKLSTIVILMLIPIEALLNATVEEVVFRGIIQTELSRVFSVSVAIFLQAFLFAGFHYAGGFPNGLTGFAMTFVYACALGVMRYKVKGLLAPIIIHTFADMTILIFLWLYF
ncbi:CPBP family intramembrane glutamic endopeptidase [Francisella philomiragia]|uniref:CAAX protease self-immunity family protein n=1 Tax=Francisella philomiragia TaxID=28110 RepID=A0A0B6CWZ6_9GAMM|nr:CPBP family intramembrane glutamic endopeptidase [Francisella philomiragia]AJI53375.1 CAAX protease self-immunity family protein [Francisella philomiragia]